MITRTAALAVLLWSCAGLQAQHAVRVHEDLQYAEGFAKDGRRNALDLYLPVGVDRPALAMFVHGGGWFGGAKEWHEGLGRELAKKGLACALINTRMFPFVRPDAMVEDCAHAIGWLHREAAGYGCDGSRLYLIGHSAGGHLVSWLALDEARWGLSGAPREALRGVIALSGIYDVRSRHRFLDGVFGRCADLRLAASPVLHVDAEDPPHLLLWGQKEMSGLPITARMLAGRLRRCGVAVEAVELAGRDHVDYVRRAHQPGSPLVDRILDYVRRTSAQRPAASVPVACAVEHREDVLRGRGGMATDLFLPDIAPRKWLVLAVSARERAMVVPLARGLAKQGGAVSVVVCDSKPFPPRPGALVPDQARIAAFVQTLRLLADVRSGHGLPRSQPFLGAVGDAGWLVAVAPVRCAGRILLGSGAGASVVHGVFGGRREHGQDPNRIIRANQPPILLVTTDGDAEEDRQASALLRAALTRLQDCAFDGQGRAVLAGLRDLGEDDDLLLPLVAAFARL